MSLNRPSFVASQTTGVDGASEGGRMSSIRLPSLLSLYGVSLVRLVKLSGYQGKLDAEPALEDGRWVLKLVYEGDEPSGVPPLWHGRTVVVEPKPADG